MKRYLVVVIFLPLQLVAQEGFSLKEKVNSVLTFTAPLVYVEDLARMKNAVILDARKQEEFDVSHLPGAIYAGDKKIEASALSAVEKSDTLIVYCTVGFRSEKIAEQLLSEGYTNTYNLFGGIFAWKNNGGIVVDNEGRTTQKVHCYNKSWSLFLLEGEKVY